MSVEDKLTNVAVRRILTSLWVDITLVNVRTTGGVVYVSGHLKRMTSSHNQFDQLGLREMDMRLRKIRGVRDLKYRFDNWRRNVDGGCIHFNDATQNTRTNTLSSGAQSSASLSGPMSRASLASSTSRCLRSCLHCQSRSATHAKLSQAVYELGCGTSRAGFALFVRLRPR